MSKYTNPKGTRDFSPAVMAKRQYVFDTIRSVFEKFGLMALETPSLENLNTLTGKYGEEGDRLIFKVLNSGNYLKKSNKEAIENLDSKKLTSSICDRALRYDLTVPLARFVVQHHNEIKFPFKRYHIGPVWRADRPQKGRYREFYQCDADCLGSTSLLQEVELMQVFHQVFKSFKMNEMVRVELNNRKILQGLSEVLGIEDNFIDFTIALDKLDKIGTEKVLEELRTKGIHEDSLSKIKSILELEEAGKADLAYMKNYLKDSEVGLKGCDELAFIFKSIEALGVDILDFKVTLARGLNYYTGAIYEVIMIDKSMGSLGSGGRYDNLTEIFGLKDMSGVGISFGADRICDVLEDKNLYPTSVRPGPKLIFLNLDENFTPQILKYLQEIREAGISADYYPDTAKMKKQMKYANDLGISYVAIIGDDEYSNQTITLKNMEQGSQETVNLEKLIEVIIP